VVLARLKLPWYFFLLDIVISKFSIVRPPLSHCHSQLPRTARLALWRACGTAPAAD